MELRTAPDIHIAEFAVTHIQAKKAEGASPPASLLGFFCSFSEQRLLRTGNGVVWRERFTVVREGGEISTGGARFV